MLYCGSAEMRPPGGCPIVQIVDGALQVLKERPVALAIGDGNSREAGMTVEVDAPSMLDKATEAVHEATEAVQTSQSIAGTIDWVPGRAVSLIS